MTSEPTALSDGHGDILAELTAVLAGVVDVDPDRIDPEQPFPVLGLDSLLTVEFVAAVARSFGVRITGAALYEHPTPALLARHLTALRRGAGDAPAVQGSGASAEVLQVLRQQLARILHCDPWEIDGGAAFAELGIDSILAADFVAGVNRAYGLNERPVTVHEHPSLAAMAAYVASRTGGTVTPAAPDAGSGAPAGAGARQEPPATAPAKRPPLSQEELVALLDAVRGDRIGVGEAAALLADRSA
ncbi:phosphopantetheine-binding protein [Streptomyces barringtoniae]|uniref:phosphopantetheine-binding protein n=1 Tax=Streptomyces barringtoniae TaxID=2892029 RepID=UPI001E6419B9|nr:phosphopantetheine-binding protein [Streptomyces barringtoniae]MCC5480881.1 phosphopantetheine-binding protein [Streptomyces barringtoniae]